MAKRKTKKVSKKVEKVEGEQPDRVTVNYNIKMAVSFQTLGYELGMSSSVRPDEAVDEAFGRVLDRLDSWCETMDREYLSDEAILNVVEKKAELEARAKRGR